MTDIAQLGFAVDTGGLRTGERGLNSYAATGERTERRMGRSVSTMNRDFLSLNRVIGAVGVTLAGLGVSSLGMDVKSYADEWKGLSSQIRQVTDSEADLVKVRKELLQVSQDTRTELGTTVSLYTELKRSTDDLGIGQAKQVQIVKTLNNLFTAGGKPISEMTGAIRQLSQGFASGVLRGDEFNSVAEGAPRIMDALTVSLGMTRGELREFAATGGITAEIMVKALEGYSDAAQKMADQTAKKFAQSTLAAENNALEWVGSNKTINDSLNTLGATIEDFSENLGSIADAGQAFITVIGAGLLISLGKTATALIATTVSTVAYNVQLARMAGLSAAYSVQAGIATVATRGLGVALKFALGPWGLLLSAIGVAGAVFLSSKDDANEFTAALKEQKKITDELTTSLGAMNKEQLNGEVIKQQAALNELMTQRLIALDKQNDIINNRGSGGGQFSMIKGYGGISEVTGEVALLDKQISQGNASIETMRGLIESLGKSSSVVTTKTGGGKLTASQKEYNKWLESVTGYLTPLEQAELKIQRVNDAIEAGLPVTQNVTNYLTMAKDELSKLNEKAENTEYIDWLNQITDNSTIGRLQDIQEEITATWMAIDGGDLGKEEGLEYIDKLEKRAKELSGVLSGSDMFNAISSSAIDGLKSIQSLSEQGSSEYAKLGIAVQAVTALQAVQAVVNQAAGTNPYESFAKMAAMVAALGSLGVSVGGLSSGFSDDSADNQAGQGLDAWGDKSESISNSIDMTANATDKLVSINTNMLSALESLADDISSAVTLSLRGDTYDDLSTSVSINENLFEAAGLLGTSLDSVIGFLSGGLLTGLLSNTLFDKIGSFLGGSSSTTDKGIEIAGGTLGALATDADVDAYIDTKYKKWKFGSTKRRTDYADLDDASAQFSLVFASLADSVYEGATALGMSSEAVTDAVNAFEIETFQISLKGLSTEEQAAEVEAVFASIFDDLALSIVPYLSDFQELGEGYGETLARIATEVGIAEVLVDQLGITIGDKLADPEMYITIANNLSTLAGGIDDFADKTASFIDAFAPDSVKLDIYTDAMIDALSGVGLALPSTTEEFFNLLQGLDATTDAGQEQVATLLNLTDTASEYYDLLDSTVGDFNDSLETLTTSIMSTIDDMFGITYEDALTSLDDALLLARAGSFDSALGLDLTSLSGDESDFSSLADFNIAQARTGNKLADLAALTGETMTTADYALNESIEQTSLLKSLKEGIAKANELLTNQNRLQAESADTLDTINNKTEYA